MRRQTAIHKLKAQAKGLRELGVTSVYLFGSTAHDRAGPDSDVDIFYDYELPRFSLINVVRIKRFLESKLRTTVDAIPRNSLHPRLRRRVQDEAIQVY